MYNSGTVPYFLISVADPHQIERHGPDPRQSDVLDPGPDPQQFEDYKPMDGI